jgi:hypothetical protein
MCVLGRPPKRDLIKRDRSPDLNLRAGFGPRKRRPKAAPSHRVPSARRLSTAGIGGALQLGRKIRHAGLVHEPDVIFALPDVCCVVDGQVLGRPQDSAPPIGFVGVELLNHLRG